MKTVTTIEKSLEFICQEHVGPSSHSFDTVDIPFEISSTEYLEFAELDIKNTSKHGLVNALSNTKRALDCRVESVLFTFGLLKIANKNNWSVPKKLVEISSLGVLAPRVLHKLNKARNLIEHEFKYPAVNEVEDFIDIVSLFLESTKIFLYNVPNDIEFESSESEDYFVTLNFEREIPQIVLNRGEFTIGATHKLYIDFVKAYANCICQMYT